MNVIVVRTMFALVCVGFAGTAVAEDVPQAALNLNPLSAIDPASLTGFRDRPLFSPSRSRPPDRMPEAETEPVEAPPETLDIQLLGVIGTPDGLSALVLDLDDDTRHSLRTRDTYHGWTISDLNGTEMVISRDEDSQRFPIFKPAETAPESGETPPSDGDTAP